MAVEYKTFLPIPHVPKDSPVKTHCYLCGRSKQEIEADPERDVTKRILEVEHVVPKVVFNPKSTDRPVILWACHKCNSAKGFDDEYITGGIQLVSVGEGSAARIERFLRSIHNPKASRLKADFDRRVDRRVELGNEQLYWMNSTRMQTYLTNIAKGLWVRNTLQLKNWDEYSIYGCVEQSASQNTLLKAPHVERMVAVRNCAEEWTHHFAYCGSWPTEPTEADRISFWAMTFYGSVSAVVWFSHIDGPRNPELLQSETALEISDLCGGFKSRRPRLGAKK